MNPDRPNRAPEVKAALTDVRRLLEQLGLFGEGRARQRQSAGWLIRCPVHADRSPSCSVQLRDGLVVWKCHACDATGDALTLIAVARGLNLRSDFRAVLAEGARLAGLWGIVDELECRSPRDSTPMPIPAPTRPASEPERVYPPLGEVESLWGSCGPVTYDAEAAAYLARRGFDPERVEALDVLRALPAAGALPRWASYRGGAATARSWRELGFRLLVAMLDAAGAMRSVRGWRVTPGDGPKRLPPAGHKASELVMADAFGAAMLRGERSPETIAVVEGEPDFVARCSVQNDPRGAVLGIVSGSWGPTFAEKIPVGARVAIRTDHDAAGDRYAAEIAKTLARRCFPFRSRRPNDQAA